MIRIYSDVDDAVVQHGPSVMLILSIAIADRQSLPFVAAISILYSSVSGRNIECLMGTHCEP